ncbi:MAG TPA: hypothetical protein VHE30_16025 [Polyangiaceae bacterium]|nr:hypothetical protein [Polyangiaceae bacterium]
MASQSSIVLAVAVGGAAVFAFFRAAPPAEPVSSSIESERRTASGPENAAPDEETLPPDHPPLGAMGAGELGEVDETEPLPPDHPPVGAMTAAPGLPSGGAPEASIQWKVPAAWMSVQSTSGMRLATYRIPRASGVTEDAELAVVRAGGSPEANIDRWVKQFTAAEPEKRAKKTVHGRTVWLVDITGTFGAGSMGGPGGGAHPGWSLAGAIVEGGDDSYFFKLTGPTASVRAARKDFDALVDSIAPRPGDTAL